MRVLLLFLDTVDYNREASKIVNLPQNINPFIGMTIHTENDLSLVVKKVEASIDQKDTPEEPSITLILEDELIDDAKEIEQRKKILDINFEVLKETGWETNF
ncbi:MAG: hypothetical protein WCS89_01485 [Candidatus Paceibacterota bacterium]|jgi:hypothetical protein